VDLETAAVSIPGADLEADRVAGLTEARAGVSAAPMASDLVQASLHKVLEWNPFIVYFGAVLQIRDPWIRDPGWVKNQDPDPE
jgi:hypothetical protein